MRVPLVDLAAQQAEISQEVKEGIDEVMASTAFIGGKAVAEFENAYRDFIGVSQCVGVANGTDAVELALRAVGIAAGDEIIVPANSFIATAEAVSRIGAVPVLVDVDPIHLLIDPAKVAAALTAATRAIVPVHLFGQVAPVEQLVDMAVSSGVHIVEDAAQAQGATRHGAPAGGLGAIAGTSFYPGKNLGAAGDAGAVLTDDVELAERVRVLAAHGSDRKYVHDVIGMNSRLDALQAVVLSAKLRRLSQWNAARRAAADRYDEMLADVRGVTIPARLDGNVDVWHLYVVQVSQRDRVLEALLQAGVGAAIHYPTPIHLTGAYASLGKGSGSFPVAEEAAQRILSLPLYPHITPEQQEYVVAALAAALEER
jgi:dTDP-4-amino-4,6-dideoxygalactose transaminase